MQNRYLKNIGTIGEVAQAKMGITTVAVVGLGGIGGFLIEGLSRLGVKKIIGVDMDSFEESNLNRQILSNINNIGKYKVFEAEKRVKEINHNVYFEPIKEKAYAENLDAFLYEAQFIFDATDNYDIRKSLSKFAQKNNKILIHGGCAGWYGQVTIITPETPPFEKLIKSPSGIENETGNPVFSPMLIASLELSEFCKIISQKGEILKGYCLLIDLLNNNFRKIEY